MDPSYPCERVLVPTGVVCEIAFWFGARSFSSRMYGTTRRDMTGPNMTREEMT